MSIYQQNRAPCADDRSPCEPDTCNPAQMRALPGRDVFDTMSAAEYLCVSVATLELLRVRGGGPNYVKLKRLVRYRRASLDEWMLSRERCSTAGSRGAAR